MKAIAVGDRVIDRYGEPGRVVASYRHFWDPRIPFPAVPIAREEWLADQFVPFTPEQLAEPWATVRGDSGRCSIGPLSTIRRAH